MDETVFYKKYIEYDFNEHFVPGVFEKICRQFLIRKNLSGEINPVIEKIGKYYYNDIKNQKNGEFDIVTLDEKGYIFYEAKYKNRLVTDRLVQKEIEQVRATDLQSYRYDFFSKPGFADNVPEDIIRYSLDDLYD